MEPVCIPAAARFDAARGDDAAGEGVTADVFPAATISGLADSSGFEDSSGLDSAVVEAAAGIVTATREFELRNERAVSVYVIPAVLTISAAAAIPIHVGAKRLTRSGRASGITGAAIRAS